MSCYVIGDIQGCFVELQALLQRCGFDAQKDRLWLVGDLVNRGPDSLAVLRWARSLGERCISVLGNHDLHLLALAEGLGKSSRGDTLQAILQAPDADDLLHWLRHRPLLHAENGWILVHAGLWPDWSLEQACTLAREVEEALRGPGWRELLHHMYGNQPDHWQDDLQGYARLRFIINVMTRMRLIHEDMRLDLDFKGELPDAPPGLRAWFDYAHRRPGVRVLCGHWSALGVRREASMVALDSGCIWGGPLTAMRLEDGELFQQPALQQRAPALKGSATGC